MKAKTYRKITIIMLVTAMICASVYRGQEVSETVQGAEETTATDAPQTDPPQTDPPQTDPPQTDPPQTDPPQTDPPQTDPPQTDPPQPVTEPQTQPQTQPVTEPQTQPQTQAQTQAQTSAPVENHSTAIPDDPTEKKLKQTIVDAGETDEGYSVSVNGGTPAVIEPDKSFREVVNAITGGSYGYLMDYIRPNTKLREPIDIEGQGSIGSVFAKVRSMPGASCDIVLYINNGNSLWLNMRVSGSLESEDAAIAFTSNGGETCTVSYDANGGSLSNSISIVRQKGEWYSHFDVKASKDGASFCGWYEGPEEGARRVFPTDTVERDITLYAHYNPYGTEVIAFDFGFSTEGDSGSLVHRLIMPKNEDGTYDVAVYPSFEHNGLVIGGWLDESGNPISLTGLSGFRTLKADWKDPSELLPQETAEETEAAAETEETVETETEE